MNSKHILMAFGLVNLTLLGFFTPLADRALFSAQDPLFFEWPAMVLIALWGLAYIAAAPLARTLPLLMLVFAIEKLLFGGRWLWWINANSDALPALIEQDLLVGLFYAVYGLWDTFCGIVFLVLAWSGFRNR